jgi:peptidyl-prolyl cis-trans isomerase C
MPTYVLIAALYILCYGNVAFYRIGGCPFPNLCWGKGSSNVILKNLFKESSMNMHTAKIIGVGGLLALGFLGCSQGSKDTTRIIANVAGERITEGRFREVAVLMIGDEKKADELLKSEDKNIREQRNRFLESMALQKSTVLFAKDEGLEKDPKVQMELEQMKSRVYVQALIERRLAKNAPLANVADDELKKTYDELLAQSKAKGQDKNFPSFEQAKTQLAARWKQQKQQENNEKAFQSLLEEIRQKYPITFAEGFKPSPQPAKPAQP